ncbi:MAG: phosphonate C-P lyase system protein PhnH [Pseudomonadota bacterium]
MDAAVLEGGFEDLPQQLARAFRAALEALSDPGAIRSMERTSPPEIGSAAGALLLTLCDGTTRLWLPERLNPGPADHWILFHTNASVTRERGEADFALGRWAELAPLSDWKAGTPDFPDRSATLLVEVDGLEGGDPMRLSGPGIPGHRSFAPRLPDGAAQALAENASRFPLGVDVILVAGNCIAAIPRSTRIGV